MVTNSDCTILSRTVNQNRQYVWKKTIHNNVYFEFNKISTSGETPKEESTCYCCIYGDTSINAKLGDIIVKGIVEDTEIDITKIMSNYNAYSITKIQFFNVGNLKHTEIEGA